MGHFASQLEPGAIGERDPEGQFLTDISVYDGVDKTPALREVGDARRAVEGAAPNGVKTNLQSLFAAAVVHGQGLVLGTVLVRTEVRPLLGDEMILYHGVVCLNPKQKSYPSQISENNFRPSTECTMATRSPTSTARAVPRCRVLASTR